MRTLPTNRNYSTPVSQPSSTKARRRCTAERGGGTADSTLSFRQRKLLRALVSGTHTKHAQAATISTPPHPPALLTSSENLEFLSRRKFVNQVAPFPPPPRRDSVKKNQKHIPCIYVPSTEYVKKKKKYENHL